MHPSTILSVAALLFASATTAIPTSNAPLLAVRDEVTLQARAPILPEDAQKYIDYKNTEAHAPQVASRKDAAFEAWRTAKPAQRAARLDELNAVKRELCAMWTVVADGRAHLMSVYNDQDQAHLRELQTAQAQKRLNC